MSEISSCHTHHVPKMDEPQQIVIPFNFVQAIRIS